MAGLTDEEMAALEAKHGGLTDEQMAAKEASFSGKPSMADIIRKRRDAAGDPELAPPVQPPPTMLQSAASGVGQGMTLGFGDEIGAAFATLPEMTKRAGQSLGLTPKPNADIEGHFDQESANAAADKQRGTIADYYRRERDSRSADNKTAEEANPRTFGAGKLAGNIAVPIPGGAGVGLVGKMGVGAAKGAGFGALTGLGESTSDLTRGDYSGAAKDTAKGAGLGAAGGALGGAADAGLSKLGSRFSGAAKAIKDEADAAAYAKLQKSKIGGVRQKFGEDLREQERLTDNSANANLPQAERDAAAAELASPEGKARALRAAQALRSQIPGRRGELEAAQQELANVPADAAAASDAKFGGHPIIREAWPRIKHYALPAIGAGLGSWAAGPEGAVAGAAVGQMMGRPGRALVNFARKPEVQSAAMGQLSSLADAAGGAARKAAAPSLLEQYLSQPAVDDDERQKQAAAHFTKSTGG